MRSESSSGRVTVKATRITKQTTWGTAVLIAVSLAAAPAAQAQTPTEINAALQAAYAKYKTLQEGKNADYIPALAKVDPNLFGIVLVTADGKVYSAGDVT